MNSEVYCSRNGTVHYTEPSKGLARVAFYTEFNPLILESKDGDCNNLTLSVRLYNVRNEPAPEEFAVLPRASIEGLVVRLNLWLSSGSVHYKGECEALKNKQAKIISEYYSNMKSILSQTTNT